jgi:hypothetical protein
VEVPQARHDAHELERQRVLAQIVPNFKNNRDLFILVMGVVKN